MVFDLRGFGFRGLNPKLFQGREPRVLVFDLRGFGFRVLICRYRVWDSLGFRIWGSGSRVLPFDVNHSFLGHGFRVLGSLGFRVFGFRAFEFKGFGFRVVGFRVV